MTLSENIERKFVESYPVTDWEVYTDTGWQDINFIHKTIPYKVWKIVTSKGYFLECADDHIVFDEHFNEIFVKDLIIDQSWIIVKDGIDYITEKYEYNHQDNMYDLEIDSTDHRFYTNGILSHNTTTSVGFMIWATIFQENYSIAITANKRNLAIDVLSRYQLAYENLPMWIQQGVVEWNKGKIELENGSKIIAAATSASSVRGGSFNCVIGDTKVIVFDSAKKKLEEIPIDQVKDYHTKVYTSHGLKPFEGVLKSYKNETLIKIEYDDDELICTKDHKLLLKNEIYLEAKDLTPGINLFGGRTVINISEIDYEGYVYDLLNVKDLHNYYTNGIISHNCITGDNTVTVRDRYTGKIETISIDELKLRLINENIQDI